MKLATTNLSIEKVLKDLQRGFITLNKLKTHIVDKKLFRDFLNKFYTVSVNLKRNIISATPFTIVRRISIRYSYFKRIPFYFLYAVMQFVNVKLHRLLV